MKNSSHIIYVLFTCAVFFFMGFMGYSKFYSLVLPNVEGIKYKMELYEFNADRDLFGAVIALIPLLLYLTWQATPMHTMDKKTLSALFVLVFLLLAIYIRYKILVSDFLAITQSSGGGLYTPAVPFQQLDYEWYIAGGLIAGCLFSYLSFHNKVVNRKMRRA